MYNRAYKKARYLVPTLERRRSKPPKKLPILPHVRSKDSTAFATAVTASRLALACLHANLIDADPKHEVQTPKDCRAYMNGETAKRKRGLRRSENQPLFCLEEAQLLQGSPSSPW